MAEEQKKAKRKRRNFAKTVNELETYCEIAISLLATFEDDFNKGQKAALNAVLKRLTGENGKG